MHIKIKILLLFSPLTSSWGYLQTMDCLMHAYTNSDYESSHTLIYFKYWDLFLTVDSVYILKFFLFVKSKITYDIKSSKKHRIESYQTTPAILREPYLQREPIFSKPSTLEPFPLVLPSTSPWSEVMKKFTFPSICHTYKGSLCQLTKAPLSSLSGRRLHQFSEIRVAELALAVS